jgi:hypothetical protein
MLKDLPLSLLQASMRVVETKDVLESCISCGAVLGTCIHSDGLQEDTLSAEGTPSEDDPEEELSGDTEEVVINPEYKTSLLQRPK